MANDLQFSTDRILEPQRRRGPIHLKHQREGELQKSGSEEGKCISTSIMTGGDGAEEKLLEGP